MKYLGFSTDFTEVSFIALALGETCPARAGQFAPLIACSVFIQKRI